MKLLLIVYVLGCLAALCQAEREVKCGQLDRLKVDRQWDKAYGEGPQRIQFAIRFWKNMFKTIPSLRPILSKFRSENIYSAPFQAFSQQLFSLLTLQLQPTTDAQTMNAIQEAAKLYYDELGLPVELYETMGGVLLETLPEFLGSRANLAAFQDCLRDLIQKLS